MLPSESMDYLCHQCAADRQLLNSPPADLLATSYQLDKYLKHTTPDPKYRVQSIFDSTDSQVYRGYVVESLAAGSVELDAQGRTNIVWTAGSPTGFRLEFGRLIAPMDAVKVVLSTSTATIHAFPARATTFIQAHCAHCGRSIIR